MKRSSFLRLPLLGPTFFLACLLLPCPGLAQWELAEEDWPYERIQDRPFPVLQRNTQPDTLLISAASPFFDDFSNRDGKPDTSRWFTPELFFDVPELTYGMAVSPPSQGVVTFDGIARDGEPYATNALVSGLGDRLFSQCIDLSSYGPGDQLVLSFALQPQGLGDAPESDDNFEVLFRTTNPPPNDYRRVFTIQGNKVRSFRQYSILLDQEDYFHECFQIAFQRRGSLSVPADHWHLDYVYLAPGRSLADTAFVDVSPLQWLSPPIERYSAITLQHFNQGGQKQDFAVALSNNNDGNADISYQLKASDPRGFNPWKGADTKMGSQSLSPFATNTLSFTAFENQNFAQTGGVALDFLVQSPGDVFPQNDTLQRIFPIDSLWAYDDGEADGLFGLNRAFGYGVQLDLDVEDSISALWIHFEPLVHVNNINGQTTFMKDETFRIIIWNKPHPDSIVDTKIHRVSYGENRRAFIRYPFNTPVPMSGRVWVGVQQMSKLPLGVGVDRNYNRENFMFYDSLGTWTQARIGGSLMIRPESFHGGRFTAGLEEGEVSPFFSIYPNPSREGKIGFRSEIPIDRLTLRNIFGQVIWQKSGPFRGEVDLADYLQPGLYVWEVRFRGKKKSSSVKWQYLGG